MTDHVQDFERDIQDTTSFDKDLPELFSQSSKPVSLPGRCDWPGFGHQHAGHSACDVYTIIERTRDRNLKSLGASKPFIVG
jgi:hypothetical protein